MSSSKKANSEEGYTAQKMKFPLWISSVNVTKSTVSCGFGLVTFTEEILNGKFNFLCSDNARKIESHSLKDVQLIVFCSVS